MKKQTLILVVLFCCTQFAMAQKTAIKVNLLSPTVRTLNVSVEQAIAKQSSIQLGFYYSGLKVGDTKFSGFGLTPEFRYYLGDTPAIAGFYVAPFLRYANMTLEVPVTTNQTTTTSKGTLTTFGGGVVIGKQWVFQERVTLDLFIGPKYSQRNISVTAEQENDFDLKYFGNFGLRGGLTLGVAF